jgi:hypothetical protein
LRRKRNRTAANPLIPTCNPLALRWNRQTTAQFAIMRGIGRVHLPVFPRVHPPLSSIQNSHLHNEKLSAFCFQSLCLTRIFASTRLQSKVLLALALSIWGGLIADLRGQLSSNASVFAVGLDYPRGLTFGPDGYLYVAEAERGSQLDRGPLSTRCQRGSLPRRADGASFSGESYRCGDNICAGAPLRTKPKSGYSGVRSRRGGCRVPGALDLLSWKFWGFISVTLNDSPRRCEGTTLKFSGTILAPAFDFR